MPRLFINTSCRCSPRSHLSYITAIATVIAVAITTIAEPCAGKASATELVISCGVENDLYRVLSDSCETLPTRYDTPAQALRHATPGSAVMILADGYPQRTTDLPATLVDEVKKKNLRLYIEYPTSLPGLTLAKPHCDRHDRAVIASDFFGSALPKLRILAINGLHVLPTKVDGSSEMADGAHIVSARVAGFDKAVYGLPEKTLPILFTCGDGRILVSTTKLSNFVTGRYAPRDAWAEIWQGILKWLRPNDPLIKLSWKATTEPAYDRDERLPADAQSRAVRNGAEWFVKSKLLIDPTRLKQIEDGKKAGIGLLPTPPADAPVGDGSLGIMEGPMSVLQPDGNQLQSASVRGDCCAESAMALAFSGKLNNNAQHTKIAKNLLDYYYFTSESRKGKRADPNHPAYGLIAWGISSPAWLCTSYGDDNARLLLSTIAVAALCDEDRWDEAMSLCLLANLRTTGPRGFRLSRIDMNHLEARGWQYFYKSPFHYPSAHFQAYLWACYLWAYDKTGDKLFLDAAKRGINEYMAVYPDGIRWPNGLAQERARIILPLAWLVRVENTPENRQLLDRAVDGLLSIQAPCGAIQEELGPLENGKYPPPKSNEDYGAHEAPLIQSNGDPVADMLYTTNFAFAGLREATGATNDPKIRAAEDRMAEFLCRIQVKSNAYPSLDGGWFRAFDFKRWEFWGSNADAAGALGQ